MKEKEVFRIKQYFIWIGLLARRLLRQPAYIGLLLLIPVAGGAVGLLERSAGGGAVVAVCAEQGSWSSDIVASLQEQAADSVLRFTFCEDREQAKELVLLEEADCGFVIPADIEERVLQGEYEQCIAVYETAASSITGMAKERIAGVLFRLYSEYRYAAYMEQTAPEAVGYAMEAYTEHLSDESTFDFRYFYHDPNSQNIADTGDGNDTIVKAAVFPVKGVFAVLIFVAGMCGMLEYEKDKKEKRFMRIAPNALTYLVDVWISTVFVSGAVLICLWITEGLRACGDSFTPGGMAAVWSAGMWLQQAARLLLYQCIVTVYCVILRVLLRRQETIAAAIPVLTLGSLLCAPVFIRLGSYLPVFAVLEKLFPASYYLLL